MFAQHQPILSQWARGKPENLARVAMFAAASAHVPFAEVVALFPLYGTPEETPDVRPRLAYGHRRAALADLEAGAEAIHWNLEDLFRQPEPRRLKADAMLRYAAGLPGLGLAKAGFFLQMAYGLSGCLDTHNLARLGVPLTLFRGRSVKDSKTPKTQARWVSRYNGTVYRAGGTERLWDTWCTAMHLRYPSAYATSAAVSAGHLAAFSLS